MQIVVCVGQSQNTTSASVSFIENRGQLLDAKNTPRPDLLFKANNNGSDVYIRKTGMSYVLNNYKYEPKKNISPRTKSLEFDESSSFLVQRIDVDFEKSNKQTKAIGYFPSKGVYNYFTGKQSEGITNVSSYKEVRSENLYNNIDIRYYSSQAGLKYDFIVKPNADYKQIALKYTGADKLELKGGALIVHTQLGDLEETIPSVYQEINNNKQIIPAKYILRKGLRDEYYVSFDIGTYNKNYQLIIDPWATFLGGSGDEAPYSIITDNQDNIITTCSTTSVNFPTSTGAYQTSIGGNGCTAITKFDKNGNLIFSTYYGNQTIYGGVACDANNNILVTGGVNINSGGNIPTINPGGGAYFNATPGAIADAYILKLDPTGIPVWSTYFGGSGGDYAMDVTVTTFGEIAITGYTTSTDFPISGAYKATLSGWVDIFVTKFSINGVLNWSTYFGGTADVQPDWPSGIKSDNSGNIFVCGYTQNTDFTTTGSAHQPTYGGGQYDGYIFKLLSNGSLDWSTYYGGTDWDQVADMFIGNADNVYVCGVTRSTNAIATPGVYTSTGWASGDGFVAGFNNLGVRKWGTYINGGIVNGGSGRCYGVAYDFINSHVVFSGVAPFTSEPFFGNEWNIKPRCAYNDTVPVNTGDIEFIGNLDTTGNIVCIGPFNLSANNIKGASTLGFGNFTTTGNLALSGCYAYTIAQTYPNNSNNIPNVFTASAGAFQQTYGGGNWDAVVTKTYVNTCGGSQTVLNFVADKTNICSGESVNFTSEYPVCAAGFGTPTYSWTFTGGSPSTSLSATPPTITYNSPGVYDVKLVIQLPCGNDSVLKSSCITVGGPTVSVTPTNVACNNQNSGSALISITGGSSGSYTYSWISGSVISTNTFTTANNLTAGSYTVTVVDGLCSSTKTFSITEPTALTFNTPSVTSASCGINNGSASISASGGTNPLSYSWSTSANGQTISNQISGSYFVTVTDGNNCTQSTTVTISNINGASINSLTVTSVTCNGQNNGSATVNLINGSGGTYTYSWSTGSISSTNTSAVINNLSAGNYTVTVIDGSCTTTSSVTITEPIAINFSAPLITPATCGFNNGAASITASGGTNPLNYSWSTNASGQTISSQISGNYFVTVTDGNNCTLSTSIIIGSSGGASISSISTTDVACNGGTTGSATVSLVNGSGGVYSYSWSGGSISSTNSIVTINNLSAGNYIVTVLDGSCSATSTVIISQPAVIAVNINAVDATCGNNNGQINLSVSGGNGGFSYLWSNNEITKDIVNLSPAAYMVTITDNKNCSTVLSTNIANISSTVVSINATSTNIEQGSSTVLIASGGSTYSWTPSADLSCSNCALPTAQPTATTTYTVVATDVNNCTSQATITIIVKKGCVNENEVFVANVFSPNGDNQNDILQIQGSGLINIQWSIYDRWGNLIFESNDQAKGWDGTKNGKQVNADTYVYYLNATCKQSNEKINFKGNVTIVK